MFSGRWVGKEERPSREKEREASTLNATGGRTSHTALVRITHSGRPTKKNPNNRRKRKGNVESRDRKRGGR